MRVAIVGAGIGGLALAHGLSGAGLDVRVYERDPSPRHRRQGYRIHISPVGEEALAAVLPSAVRRRVIETATHPGDLVSGFDRQLRPTFEQTFPGGGPETVSAVDRYAFRRALMTGLDARLEFGRPFESYRALDDGVELRFADGTTETADLLVGADGVGSRIRGQLLPSYEVIDIGIRCVYGKIPLTDELRGLVPPAFLRGFSFVSDGPGGVGAAFAPVLFRTPPEEYGDYLMAVLTGSPEALGHSDEQLFSMRPEQLWETVTAKTADWHPTVRRLIAAADQSAAFPITLRSSLHIEPWTTGRVTLLGDAIHPMTPAAGAGANTALWDAAELTRALTGSAGLHDALAAYEHAMIENSQPIVTESLQNARQMFGVTAPSV
ncbi:FAD-dependent oxidoreductase [Kribbella italica]|uniref:2-polyprenyl-6-methoxyphenol hydroxylase-like FAD-dependent oxidoreductase n=1 Tax=Kribbella italica TaxID=1540520 RepID=A0A7W9J729_9ACTN|nr:NAD(P)/FAD-dependent oxidoreductase [Kribbella italica]MBB5836708.1 2-polyprenyl-6-methoxyphenol hydroxylase-like FAD-dependent oxidoreductase [Kribbella italica]